MKASSASSRAMIRSISSRLVIASACEPGGSTQSRCASGRARPVVGERHPPDDCGEAGGELFVLLRGGQVVGTALGGALGEFEADDVDVPVADEEQGAAFVDDWIAYRSAQHAGRFGEIGAAGQQSERDHAALEQ